MRKFRQVTLLIPLDLFIKFEAACDRENLRRMKAELPVMNLGDHLRATLIPALQVIVDKIPHEEAP